MECDTCGKAMEAREGPHAYTIGGDQVVTLLGVTHRRCPAGHGETMIPRPDALDLAVAEAVIRKRSRLTGPEAAFLRRRMGLTSTDLADVLGLTRHTLSRWENGAVPVSSAGDRALRMAAALGLRLRGMGLADLRGIAEEAAPLELVLRWTGKGWATEG